MLSLPSYFLNTNADQLSGFQKDVLSTYQKPGANPVEFKNLLVERETLKSESLRTIITSSPSYFTALAAAAEIKTLSSHRA
jgi:hypothetical protein